MKTKSTTWNYRVMKSHLHGLGIYEVHYNIEENIKYFSNDVMSLKGDSLKELKEDLFQYTEALNKPILDYDALTEQFMSRSISEYKIDIS